METIRTECIREDLVPNEFIFIVFRLFVLLPDSTSKLIHKYRCTCKLITKTTSAYVYANEQLRLCFYVIVR